MKKNDGGPAFPRPASEDTSSGTLSDGNDLVPPQNGMSLRDYFAGRALGGLVGEAEHMGVGVGVDMVAETCYQYADAMLAARAQ